VTGRDYDAGKEQRRRIKNRVVGVALAVFVVLVFLVTLVRLGQQN
jgi:hypothetical protein